MNNPDPAAPSDGGLRTAFPATLLLALAALAAVAPLATDAYLPAFGQMADDLGVSASSVQLTMTTFLVGIALGQLGIGVLSDRFGRRPLLLWGSVLALAASICSALAPSLPFLLVARFFQGLGGAAGMVLGRAVISDRSRGITATRALSLVMAIQGIAPVVDHLTDSGQLSPTLVVFATYYPDRSFATDDYEDDYELNRFFATTEIDTVIDRIESTYTTFAHGDTSDQSLRDSRTHRAFGGFSMGATTTWDVFSMRPQYFYGYMPMAGESWIGREEEADSPRIAELVTAGVERAQYGPQDFRILASVGSEDPALWDMTPQIDELREDYPDLMTEDSLQLWIDEGESHSMTSVANQVAHDLPILFPPA